MGRPIQSHVTPRRTGVHARQSPPAAAADLPAWGQTPRQLKLRPFGAAAAAWGWGWGIERMRSSTPPGAAGRRRPAPRAVDAAYSPGCGRVWGCDDWELRVSLGGQAALFCLDTTTQRAGLDRDDAGGAMRGAPDSALLLPAAAVRPMHRSANKHPVPVWLFSADRLQHRSSFKCSFQPPPFDRLTGAQDP